MSTWKREEELTEEERLGVLHLCPCLHTGQVFAKPITGAYAKEPTSEVELRLGVLIHQLLSIGVPMLDLDMELIYKVEFLENLLEFELDPPCGCPPKFGPPTIPLGSDSPSSFTNCI